MNKRLQSGEAEAVISTLGAELVSFRRKDTGAEYIWSGDAAYWTGRSPVLFPIIGAARNGEIKVDGQAYTIGNHGFARRCEFTLVEESDTTAVFLLSHSESTLDSYPFKFKLYITYTLNGNQLELGYRVDNIDEQDIFFQLGTHPAFNCPFAGEGSLADYFLEFDEPEHLERLFLNASGLLISGKSESVLHEAQQAILPLNHEMFYDGALIFREVNSRQITLKSKLSATSVVVSYQGFPDLGIWQPKDAPFVCIEPWHGVADSEHFEGELQDKEGIIRLPQGADFTSSLTIEIR
ncbi:aldose 1-epimerase family protein [Paenibacillus albidus]|uniref:aldose 1-epimerase family protein n=1 Tax=Paenibacillus albidus TaxID=2041023 RepID=UPI001BE6CDD3|nr:aldose 1-epimerase family protein [Paenibacillus albidus]MBT2289704.1 aldose 1-epimerase family protein [Paenibacillus albidus]